jgi:hypothetical protein
MPKLRRRVRWTKPDAAGTWPALRLGLLVCGGLIAASCGAEVPGENLDSQGQAVQKSCVPPPVPAGDSNYCDNPSCPCDQGEGDCDFSTQCSGGLACVRAIGLQFGYARAIDVCAPAHCNDNVLSGDETQIDCGGSCGTVCGDPCASLPPNGQAGHCTTDCRCPALESDCNVDAECAPGHVCLQNQGGLFGLPSGTDVCVGDHCSNGIPDGNEAGVDCGGSCAPCGGAAVGSDSHGGPGEDLGRAIAFDANGNFIIAGRFFGTANFGGADLTSAGSSDIFIAKYSPTGAHLWSKRFGGSDADGDLGVGVAVDKLGNVLLAGAFYATADFAGGPTLSSADNADVFAIKLDSSGNHLWSFAYGGTGIDRTLSIRSDGTNNVIIAGSFQNSVDFGGGVLTSASPGLYDTFVVKLSPAGGHIWSKRHGAAGDDIGYGLAVDNNGSALVAGAFVGTVDFGTGNVVSAGSFDGYLLKLTSAGDTAWVRRFGGTGEDRANGVAVDTARRPVVVGRFKRTVDFGGGPVTSAGTADACAIAYTSAGGFRFSKTFGGTGADFALAAATDANGNITVAGHFKDTIDYGAGPVASAGLDDVVIVSYGPTGAFRSGATYGSTGTDIAEDVAETGGILGVVGWFEGTVSFGGPAVTAAGRDVFVGRYAF